MFHFTHSPTRFSHLVVVFGLMVGLLACPSAPEPRETVPTVSEPPPAPEPEPPPRPPLGPVAHDGPMTADPGFYDCGSMRELDRCEFEIILRNTGGAVIVVEEIAQNFAPTARIGLATYQTGLARDLPYDMEPGERLAFLFSYRCEDPDEVHGGSLYVEYTYEGREYRLEIPVGCDVG